MLPFRHLSEHGKIRYVEVNLSEMDKFVKIYEGQRHVDKKRVTEFLNFQKQNIKNFGSVHFPGILTACQIRGDNKFILIDGQHRFMTMKNLQKDGAYGDFPVILQIIRVNDESELHDEFVSINKSVPVPVNVLNPDQIVNSAIDRLTSIYKEGFSHRVKMYRPQIPLDMFKDYLVDNGVVEEKGIMSSSELIDYIIKTNEILGNRGISRLQKDIARKNKAEQARIERWYNYIAKEGGKIMYIGMYKPDKWGNWLDVLMSLKPSDIENQK